MRMLKRHLTTVDDVEIEICLDINGRKFVRHHLYWSIVHRTKNPDPVKNHVIDNLKIMVNNHLSTVRWAGYEFKLERIRFDDGMEVETVLLPLKMFEDLMLYHVRDYSGDPSANECTRLGMWLKSGSLEDL